LYHKKLSTFLKKEIAFQKSTKLSEKEQYLQKFFTLTKSDLDRLNASKPGSVAAASDLNLQEYLMRADSMGEQVSRQGTRNRFNPLDDVNSESSYMNN
jgi:hypothetical protein